MGRGRRGESKQEGARGAVLTSDGGGEIMGGSEVSDGDGGAGASDPWVVVVAGVGATKNHMLGCSLSAVAVHPVPLKKQALQHCSSLTVLAKPLHDATAWHA